MNSRNGRALRAVIGSSLPLLAASLDGLLRTQGCNVEESTTDGLAARRGVFALQPDIAVFDFPEGSPTALDLLRDVRAAALPTRVILFCGDTDGSAPIDAVELGVDGLLLRTATLEAVRQCIASVVAGEQWLDPRAMRAAYDRMARRQSIPATLLTRRERDVARLVAAGQRNRVIAGELGISEGTVKMHLHNVYAKMGLESRTQLAMDMRMRELA